MGKVSLMVLDSKMDMVIEKLDKINGELEDTKIRSIRTSQGLKDHISNQKFTLLGIGIIIAIMELLFKIMWR